MPDLFSKTAALRGDFITIRWHIENVQDLARQRGQVLTDDEARRVLRLVKARHDMGIGVNWESPAAHIDYVLTHPER